MNVRTKVILAFVLIFTTLSLPAVPIHYSVHGSSDLWFSQQLDNDNSSIFGARFLPQLSIEVPISDDFSLDSEFSLNCYGNLNFTTEDIQGKIKPYRGWIRISSNQFEARVGLQRISFGSASVLRPLMWFDRIDPRDPLMLTDGVYALLLRYYFLNNTSVWAWAIYGEDKTKGWEVLPSQEGSIEYGGRLQIPLWTGQLAFSFDHRRASFSGHDNGNITVPEDKIALDGKWDIGAGFWFELMFKKQSGTQDVEKWQKALNLGLDYTFSIGNGLYIMTEFLYMDISPFLKSENDHLEFTALSLNYPLTITDRIFGMFFYNHREGKLYSFIRWERNYDKWSIYFMGFWNPMEFALFGKDDYNLLAGKGFQVMVAYNF